MGSATGAIKAAAKRTGLSIEEYSSQVSNGMKWCYVHKEWHPLSDFAVDRSRGDGRKAKCLASERGKPRGTRNIQHELARRAVAYAIRIGLLPRANAVKCSDCGHVYAEGERRHEYDHYKGYEKEHHLDVQAVCTLCHADREKTRGRQINN